MYKIISITDKQGVDKSEPHRQSHPQLLGEFYYLDMLKSGVTNGYEPHCYFIWADDSNKMMRTSRVESITEYNNIVKIVTMNSVYTFEKVEEWLWEIQRD